MLVQYLVEAFRLVAISSFLLLTMSVKCNPGLVIVPSSHIVFPVVSLRLAMEATSCFGNVYVAAPVPEVFTTTFKIVPLVMAPAV